MKVVLVILCGLGILFAGGCLVILGFEPGAPGMVALLPFGILCFNAFFMWAVLNKERWSGPALMVCGLVDFVIAGLFTQGFTDRYVGPILIILAIVLAVKGLFGLILGYKRNTGGGNAGP